MWEHIPMYDICADSIYVFLYFITVKQNKNIIIVKYDIFPEFEKYPVYKFFIAIIILFLFSH